jgi:hypothetical protein
MTDEKGGVVRSDQAHDGAFKCNPSTLFFTILGTSDRAPASKPPDRTMAPSTEPPANAHGIHYHPSIKLGVNWNLPRLGIEAID